MHTSIELETNLPVESDDIIHATQRRDLLITHRCAHRGHLVNNECGIALEVQCSVLRLLFNQLQVKHLVYVCTRSLVMWHQQL